MSKVSPGQWREISPLLGEALALSDDQRETWLQSLTARKPQLIGLLRGLLEEHRALSLENFLEYSPVDPDGGSYLRGQTVGPYTLISPIGQGGMGRVWLAARSDGRFERRVAIKFLQFSVATRAVAERFKREGRILGSLTHPHIAELIDAGIMQDGQPYMVLEYVEGEPIDQYCDARSLSVNARIRLFLDVLAALSHAHSSLIVHRDIKPSNVFVSKEGQVKLLDFGIAKLLARDDVAPGATLLTMEGGAALTPQFAAPEQVSGGAITTATDVYSTGVVLYLLLTGQHPAGSALRSPAELVKSIVELDPTRPSEAAASGTKVAQKRATTLERLRRNLRGDLDTITLKALKKSPNERYGSIAAFADDLRRYLNREPISARPDTFAYRTTKFLSRNRMAAALASLAIIAVVGGLIGTLIQAHTARRERDSAYLERDRANRITQFMIDMFKVSDPTEVHTSDVPARDILDRASKHIGDGLAQDPVLQARLMHVMGNVYKNLNQFPRAQSLLRRSLDLSRRRLGPTDPETLSTMDDLGWVLDQEGQTAGAEQLQRQALAMERSHLGPDRPVTLGTMNDLAATLATEGRTEEAEKLWRETLDRERRIFGVEDHRTLATMANLSAALGQEGRYVEAAQLGRQTLELDRRSLGPKNLQTLGVADNLAETLIYMHRYPEAEQILRADLGIVLRIVGPRHSETALIRYDLARIAAHAGQRDQSFALLRQAIDNGLSPMMLQGVGSDHELDSLHSDFRWKSILLSAKQRFAAVQRID